MGTNGAKRAFAWPMFQAAAAVGVLAISASVAASLFLIQPSVADAGPRPPTFACDGCPNIFDAFADPTGLVQSKPNDPNDVTLDSSNAFFAEDLGKNGQACYDCHQPRQGFSIVLPFIRSQFDKTGGTDAVFATNDTADRPDADISTLAARRTAFRLFLDLGIARIGKGLPSNPDFTIAQQNTARFGALPKPSCPNNDLNQTADCDPQGLGSTTLSLFRRPIVNTNVFFDSAVLWDGRASINNMDGQAKKAAQTLLLSETCESPFVSPKPPKPCSSTLSAEQVHEIAHFMTAVFTAQVVDKKVGRLDAQGATGGVDNLVALSKDPGQPCRRSGPALTIFTPATCTEAHSPTMTLFDAWATSARQAEDDNRDGDRENETGDHNAARASVARGQALFNGGAKLHLGTAVASCATCHAVNNLGDNPSDTSPLSFVRLGLDSPDFLRTLAASDHRVNSFAERTEGLPVYSLTGPTCPTLADPRNGHPVAGSNVRTTDPGRAMVTGKCADIGKFKPPVLRDLAVRKPYFHNSAAASLNDVVNFYNARFTIGLSSRQHRDLVNFLNTL